MKKLIIIGGFCLVFIAIFFAFKKSPSQITSEKAKEIISEIFQDDKIERVEGKSLVLTKNNNYMVVVVGNQYILTDFSTNPPKIHQFQSTKELITVKVLEIQSDRYLVEHDDHTHWINGKLEDVKIGDFIEIVDPHTYLD